MLAGVSGGIVGPFVIGAIKQATGSFVLPMWILACFYCLGALLYVQARRFVRRDLLSAAALDKKMTPASSFVEPRKEGGKDGDLELAAM